MKGLSEMTELQNKDLDVSGSKRFCTFHLSGRLFGVDILDVKEIGIDIKLTSIYHAPDSISGYMNIRGQIHLVIDLRKLFGFEPKEVDGQSRVILFKTKIGEPFGALVDKMGDVIDIQETQIEERRNQGPISADIKNRRKAPQKLTMGICKLESALVVIVDARNILPSITKENAC